MRQATDLTDRSAVAGLVVALRSHAAHPAQVAVGCDEALARRDQVLAGAFEVPRIPRVPGKSRHLGDEDEAVRVQVLVGRRRLVEPAAAEAAETERTRWRERDVVGVPKR